MLPKAAKGMANSVDPYQTVLRRNLIWVCTVCAGLSVPILRTFMVIFMVTQTGSQTFNFRTFRLHKKMLILKEVVFLAE